MIGNFEKWRTAPQVLRAPEGVEGGFEAPAIHVEVKEFEEYLRKALDVLTTTEIPAHDVEGRKNIPRLPSDHLAIKLVLRLGEIVDSTAEREGVIPSERTFKGMLQSLYRTLRDAIDLRLGKDFEKVSDWSKQLSEFLDSTDDAFLFFRPRLHIIAKRVVRTEKRLYARRSNKISEAVEGVDFVVERKVQSTENELWAKSKAVQNKSIVELSFQILEAELLFLERTSPNSAERNLFLATRDVLRGILNEEDAPLKSAAGEYGVSAHRIRKFREKLASWALVLLRGSEDGAPSGQSVNDYLKYLRDNLHGDRSDWYLFRDILISIEADFLNQGERVVDLAQKISEQSSFFGDQILMELWSVRMKFIAHLRYRAETDGNIGDEKNAWLKEHLEW
jgi:hypothetical protein